MPDAPDVPAPDVPAPDLPSLFPGRAAVITGAASGLGLAAAHRLAARGMSVWMADRQAEALQAAAAAVRAASPGASVTVVAADVADPAQVEALRDAVLAAGAPIGLLMNNAGVGGGGDALAPRAQWERVLSVNLWGVIHGVQAFAPAMIEQGEPALIVNTGSKQGITTPPGDTAYNVSKAGVKVVTEGLAHTLRTTPGCRVTAHLFVPGFVWTGMTARGREGDKPAGAWTAKQTVDHLLTRLAAGDFYIICPDGDVTPEMDRRRIAWAVGDVIEGRPALSRWDPTYTAAFAAHMARGG